MKTKNVKLRLTDSEWEELTHLANKELRPLNNTIAYLLRRFLREKNEDPNNSLPGSSKDTSSSLVETKSSQQDPKGSYQDPRGSYQELTGSQGVDTSLPVGYTGSTLENKGGESYEIDF